MGTGGLVRNQQGEWLAGFSSNEGQGDAPLAELLALRNGLEVAWECGYREIMCECDALDVVNVVMGLLDLNFHPHARVVLQIRMLMNRA
uniref:RNase H type-1 domain-containing protein n=1 Tax=Cajanus cajan TaxID=3821 RepID=A0A151SC93_CAJCA|nr:hypothetical protein KK1_025575 [Cajanus cajan]